MSRPLRVHYPHAWYHVMNRGAGRRKIFKSELHKKMFLELLEESHRMFNVIISAYCLMDNHYHLLLSTPDANLSRVMRHINGVYTQKYNRYAQTDGPLFRGRYKSQLIDDDCYQLIVSRYIHLNPVEAKLVTNPADYVWSSYRAYLGLAPSQPWLSKDIILKNLLETKMLAHVKDYQEYVETKQIHEINAYSSIKNITPIIGSDIFKHKIISKIKLFTPYACLPDLNRSTRIPKIETIINLTCKYYNIKPELLMHCKKATLNWPHLVSIYICRKKYGHSLRDISIFFGFKRQEAISAKIRKCQIRLLDSSKLFDEVEAINDYIRTAIFMR